MPRPHLCLGRAVFHLDLEECQLFIDGFLNAQPSARAQVPLWQKASTHPAL